jgi:hypothetical protein
MAKSTKKYKPVTTDSSDNSMERSIAYFNKNVTNFSQSTNDLIRSINTFTKSVDSFKSSVDEQKKTSKKKEKEDKPSSSGKKGKKEFTENKAWANRTQKGLDKFQARANKLGLGRLQQFTNDVFGKNATKKMTRGMAKFAGAIQSKGGTSGLGKAGIGRAMSGLGSIAGGVLRMAGPIGAIAGVAKMAFDFWDSGGLAKLQIAGKMLSGNKMTGLGDLQDVQDSLEGTEQFRKLNADYNYKVPVQLRQQAEDDMFNYRKGIEQDQLGYEQSLVKDKLDHELGLRKDVLQFQFQQAMETLDAEIDKRKAISASGMSFISKYSTISERALKAIGSSTKAIIEGVGKFQSIFGGTVKDSFALNEQAAGLAYHFGGSADDVMNMTNMFRLMGKTSGLMAQNLIAGITKFANLNKLAPQVIFNQIKDAGEDIYKFSSGTADNFVKQAGLLTKMSVSMSQMMKASDSMVLNYKDSIKAEMSLSAMLGKNVNLSEVRAKLMAGDQAGAASALKTSLGGVDINAMNPFQKQALTQATGMDISALMGLQQGKGGGLTGDLTAEKAKGAAFAEGALKADIGGAAAKLALEQKQREKLLAFEQRQRMIMLQLEQAQRLDGIFLEQKYRAMAAEKDYKFAKESMAADLQAEMASNFAVNLATGNSASLNRANLDKAAQSSFSSKVSGVDNNLTGLISSGVIKGTDMRLAEYLTKKDDILATAGSKNKDGSINSPDVIAQKLSEAMTKSFGAEMASYNAEVKKQAEVRNAQIKTFQAIADAQSAINSHKDKFGNVQRGDATSAEIKAFEKATENAKKQYPELFKNFEKHVGGNVKNYGQGKDTAFINNLKQSMPQPLDTKTVATGTQTGNKPMLDVLKTNADTQITTTTKGIDIQTRELSESQYGVKLQQEIIALLGINAQFLGQISTNTAKDASININGKTLQTSLLNQARRTYGVSRSA